MLGTLFGSVGTRFEILGTLKKRWYIDTLCSLGCYPIISKPTRVVNEVESCIDHIHTNNLSTAIKPYIMLHDISDHYPIHLIVSKTR